MRLIDADVLAMLLHDDIDGLDEEFPNDKQVKPYMCGVKMALSFIDTAPTIDAVPVVRCKDCIWWDNSEDSLYGYCMAMKHGYMSENWEIGIYRRYKGDFYCADAERKDDE